MKMDLALNKLQRLICHKIQPTKQPTFSDNPLSVMPSGARGAADRGVESLRFQVSIVRR